MAKSDKRAKSDSLIEIDRARGLVFESEEKLYEFFAEDIKKFEAEFFSLRQADDISDQDFALYEEHLHLMLDDPDEIWVEDLPDSKKSFGFYIREFGWNDDPLLYHVAVVYLTGAVPSFVFLHFPTSDESLVDRYRRGQSVFDRRLKDAAPGALPGDALMEGEDLAVGLYEAMLKLRAAHDIPEEQFRDFANFRESTIEEADEIWRHTDSYGNTLVSFIKDCSDESPELHYLVVTVEDASTNSHALLFSFPTKDLSLVTRYRHGENLQAEDVVQESSH